MEGRDRRKWGRRKKGTRERGSRPSSFAVLAYDAPHQPGEGGGEGRERGKHCSSRHNGGTKPQPEDRTLLQTPTTPSPSLFSLHESTPLLLLALRNSQPTYPPPPLVEDVPLLRAFPSMLATRAIVFSNDESGVEERCEDRRR